MAAKPISVFSIAFSACRLALATQNTLFMSTVLAKKTNEYLIPKLHLGPLDAGEKVSSKEVYSF